jgi:hypothetical protein
MTDSCPPELLGDLLPRLLNRAHSINQCEGEEVLQPQCGSVVRLEDGVALAAPAGTSTAQHSTRKQSAAQHSMSIMRASQTELLLASSYKPLACTMQRYAALCDLSVTS